MIQKDFTYSPAWNLTQIVMGSILAAVTLKGIAQPHHFIPGGLFGAASLVFYSSKTLNTSLWYLLFNIPMFVLAWRGISKRFLIYSFIAMSVFTFCYWAIEIDFHIKNQLYAAVAGGTLYGLGNGTVLRSLGSNGGLDVLGVWLFQKYNIGMGKLFFFFNVCLFLSCLKFLDIDLVIASTILVFCSSAALEYTLALFNQRKLVLVFSEHLDKISQEILSELKLGATLLNGQGAYTKAPRKLLLTVINNIQLKRLEELVFTIDANALFIVDNTFNVLGKSFSKRKIY